MTDDWLVAAIDSVERTAAAARESLAHAAEVLGPARADREAGVPLPVIAEHLRQAGLGARLDASFAILRFEQAVAALRAQMVRALVDEEGASFTGLARRMGVSRQNVARLYEAGKRAASGCPNQPESP